MAGGNNDGGIKLKRLLIISLVAIFLTFIYPITATEIEQKEAPKDQETKTGKNWSLSLKGGITLNAGNTESLLVNGGLKFHLKSTLFQYLTNFDSFYGVSKSEQTVNKGEWLNTLTMKLRKRFNLYGKASLEYDEFSDIGLRVNTGLGIQYIVKDTPKITVKVASTINGEFTNAFDIVNNINSLRSNLDFSLEQEITAAAKYTVDTVLTFNVKDFSHDYRVETRASLSVSMSKVLALRIEMTDKYTNRPLGEGIKKNDFILVTSLQVSL